MRAALHISEGHPERRDRLLRSAGNLLEDETVDVESIVVVATASGLRLLLHGEADGDRVRDLQDRGVTFRACRRTLRAAGRSSDELLDGVETVPTGVGALTRLQDEGYAYLKP